MISLKTLSLLFILISTLQHTSARPVDYENNKILIRRVDSHNSIEGRGFPFDFSQIGSTKSLGNSNNALPGEIPFMEKKDDSKSVDELPFDTSSIKDNSSSGDLPFDFSSLQGNKSSKEDDGDIPADLSQLTDGDATEESEGKDPLEIPFIGKKSETLGDGDFPFGFSRRSEISPISTESQDSPFGSSFFGGKNPFSQLQNDFPAGLTPSGTGDKTNPFGKFPFTMPSFGNGIGNFGSGGFPTSIPFFTSKSSSGDQE